LRSSITAQERIDRFLFIEPKAMQDGEAEVVSEDILANLPYHPNAYLWFDHHITINIRFFPGKFSWLQARPGLFLNIIPRDHWPATKLWWKKQID
jgi:hypothetical protein